jgi:hypothetical protein
MRLAKVHERRPRLRPSKEVHRDLALGRTRQPAHFGFPREYYRTARAARCRAAAQGPRRAPSLRAASTARTLAAAALQSAWHSGRADRSSGSTAARSTDRFSVWRKSISPGRQCVCLRLTDRLLIDFADSKVYHPEENEKERKRKCACGGIALKSLQTLVETRVCSVTCGWWWGEDLNSRRRQPADLQSDIVLSPNPLIY